MIMIMENLVMNFKREDVLAFTLKEADKELKSNFERFGNATQAWKNAGSPEHNTKEFKEFCANYLATKSKNKAGLGYVIVYEAGKADTRERPYKLDNVANEKGKRKYVTTYLICDKKTGEVLAKTTETKEKAKSLAKELYTKQGYRGDAVCKVTKEVSEGEPVAFEISYAPSASAKKGHFIYFGIERNN